ncbi:AraC family transcriptional regulator [Altererythrobacter sp. JGD-16]|uniref:AraC family transcriptional regulator n=2 Tax=Altererythrobacter lutimaris TaxID=2743979 RepID=A0A850HCU9_9SPHN|nr:AraC family transcriptional regulator [Altererythrobacter lutimaris]
MLMTIAANYTQRIERTLQSIEGGAQTGDWPDLSALAEAAAMSEFHFHRIFRLMTGETPQQTLTRARIGGSLPELKGPDGIMGATGASAYSSSQSYARALKALTGATASQLQADPALFSEVAERLKRPAEEGGVIAIEMTQLQPLTLVASRAVGAYEDLNYGFDRLFELVMQQVGPEDITGLYGVPHDDPRDVPTEACRFDCAVSTSADVEPQDDLKALEITGGHALRLRHKGDYDRVHEALDNLYRIAIALDLELADNNPLNFYHSDPESVAEEELIADIHLMLKEG